MMETKKIIVLHDCERVSFRGELPRFEKIEGAFADLRRCIYVYNRSRYDLRFVAGDFRASWIEPKLMGFDRMEWGLYLHERARVRILENNGRLTSFISPVSHHGDVYDGFLGYPLVHEPEYFPFKFWKKFTDNDVRQNVAGVWVDEVGGIPREMIERLQRSEPMPPLIIEKGGSIFGELLKEYWRMGADKVKNKAL